MDVPIYKIERVGEYFFQNKSIIAWLGSELNGRFLNNSWNSVAVHHKYTGCLKNWITRRQKIAERDAKFGDYSVETISFFIYQYDHIYELFISLYLIEWISIYFGSGNVLVNLGLKTIQFDGSASAMWNERTLLHIQNNEMSDIEHPSLQLF